MPTSLPPYVEPIANVSLDDFPRSNLAPEGCHTFPAPPDNDRYQVEYHEALYGMRPASDGTKVPRMLYVLVPSTKDPIQAAYHAGGYPCVVFVQGSAWHKQHLYAHFADHVRLCEQGFAVACVQYRESDLAPFPAQMHDVKAAIRYLRAHASDYHLDRTRFALWGDSSGAHTALLAGLTAHIQPAGTVTDPRPINQLLAEGPVQDYAFTVEGSHVTVDDLSRDPDECRSFSSDVCCIVDWYGPTVLDRMNCVPSTQDHNAPDSPEGCVLGHRIVREHPEWVAAASPLSYIVPAKCRKLPPVLICHGDADQLVSFEQSVLLFEALRAAGQKVEFYRFPGAHHGSNGFRTDEALDLVAQFLRQQLISAS